MICEQLGGKYTEKSIHEVAGNGGGSSFDGTKYDGKADKMEVLNRWRQIDKEIFKEFFRLRPVLYNMYMQHCGDIEKRNFVKSLNIY